MEARHQRFQNRKTQMRRLVTNDFAPSRVKDSERLASCDVPSAGRPVQTRPGRGPPTLRPFRGDPFRCAPFARRRA